MTESPSHLDNDAQDAWKARAPDSVLLWQLVAICLNAGDDVLQRWARAMVVARSGNPKLNKIDIDNGTQQNLW